MIKWFKKNQVDLKKINVSADEQVELSLTHDIDNISAKTADKSIEMVPELSIYARFKRSLSKTKQHFGENISCLLLGKKVIDANLLDELETLLLQADLGLATTDKVINALKVSVAHKQLTDGNALLTGLKTQLLAFLAPFEQPLALEKINNLPLVILVIGVNGAGKTTTIGKLAKQYQQQGKKVMLAAADTFRAAAVEQLQIWGQRNQIPVIAQHTGADSASVSFDALTAAAARDIDILIIDTAGRLHTQHNLMEELKKLKRVLQKIDASAPHEVMLVLDASIGQNALNQAREFHQAIGLTGLTMTKLDGSAKGGILFAIANELTLPIRYVCVGETIDDLRPFNATQFVGAIFNDD